MLGGHYGWQIEVFFRELKGQLGLQDYQGTSFARYERYVTLALLGYMVLEYQRLRGLVGGSGQDEPRVGWTAARTAALLSQMRREAEQADLRWIGERLKTRSGRRLLRQALRQGQRREGASGGSGDGCRQEGNKGRRAA